MQLSLCAVVVLCWCVSYRAVDAVSDPTTPGRIRDIACRQLQELGGACRINTFFDQMCLTYSKGDKAMKETADNPIPCAVVFEGNMYWYKDGRSDFEVKTWLTGDNVMYIEYIQSTRTFYWVTEHGEKGIHSALLSFGKIGPEKQILLGRTRVGYFKFDLPGRILISATRKELSRSTMKGGKTQSLHNHSFIWQLEIDEGNRLIYFADRKGMFVIDYDGKGLKKIHNRQPGDIFYNEADKRLYWVDSDTKTIISQRQDPLGDQHAIQKIDKDTFSLTIHNQILYFNEYAERGFTLMTLEGKRLPSLATDVVPTDDDAYLAFL